MTAANGVAVVDKVRAAWAEADRAGLPRPGRPALVELTGATEHQVRKALEDLASSYLASSSSADTSDGEPSPATPDTEDKPGPDAPDMIDDTSVGGPGSPAPITRMDVGALAGDADAPTAPGGPAGSPAGAPASPAAPAASPGLTPAGDPELLPGARGWARVGFVFGAVMSVAGNVLYTWIPPHHASPAWTPALAPQLGAAVWSIGLLISIEVLSRAAWDRGFWWGLARYGGAGAVAVGSAIISYGHLKAVLVHWGYNGLQAGVGPLVLDGIMVVSGFAMLSMSRHQPRQHRLQDRRAGDHQ